MGPVVLPGGPRTPGSAPRRLPGASKESAATCRPPPRGWPGPGGAGVSASCGGGGAWRSRYARPVPARGACAGSAAAVGRSCVACATRCRTSCPVPRPAWCRTSSARSCPAWCRESSARSWQVRCRDAGALSCPARCAVRWICGAAGGGASATVTAGARLRVARAAGAAPFAVAAPPTRVRTARSSVTSTHRTRCVCARGRPRYGVTSGGRIARAASADGGARS